MQRFIDWRVRRTTLIVVGSFACLAGVWAGQYVGSGLGAPWLLLCAGMLVLCYKKRAFVALPAVCAAGVVVGLWSGSNMALQLTAYKSLVGNQLQLQGTVVEDATYNDKKQLDFRLQHVHIGARELPGQVRVTIFGIAKPRRGDVVQVRGKLASGFGNYQAALYFASLDSLQVSHGWVEVVRREFATRIYTVLPEPQASLGLGFLVGIKSQLPDSLNDQLREVGLTHIVVASGYNLTILVRLARRLFAKHSKFQALVVGVLLMASFVAVTGFSPSMTRASLVTGLSMAAWYYGRQIHPLVILGVTAAVTAAASPLYLWSDLGWWLSFLAFAGVMMLAPLLQKRVYGNREPKLIGQMVIETLSAEVMTLPLIVTIFGAVPLLALPANVLVVPLVPLAMLLTFIAGVAAFVFGLFAPYAAMPATWLLTYMTSLVGLFAGAKLSVPTAGISIAVMLALYVALLGIGVVLWRTTKHDYLARSLVE